MRNPADKIRASTQTPRKTPACGPAIDLASIRLPADWHLLPGDPPMVQTPFDGVQPLLDALVLYELKATRSRSVDRDVRRST